MEKDIPLNIEIFSGEDNEKYRLTSAKEIKFVLRTIAVKGFRVALYYGGADDFILTTVLGVDDTGVWLEQSSNSSDNQRITESSKLVFVTSHLQIKIQFASNHVHSTVYENCAAFYLPLPDSLYRLQRREYYRLKIPAHNPLCCVIPDATPHEKQLREFIIMDISCGGVGLICAETDSEITVGETYVNCLIDLPEVGKISGTIVVKNLFLFSMESGHTQKHAGCEFKNLDGAATLLLQRYVMNMQRTKADS
ncbi:MAG: flagellar regulator YcgR PilZN domain-containing protein [Candidatus Nitrotoga sp.]